MTINSTKKLKIAGIVLVILVMGGILVSGCLEATVKGGEMAAHEGGAASKVAAVVGGAAVRAAPSIAQSAQDVLETSNEQSETMNDQDITVFDETETIPYKHEVFYLLAGDQGYQFAIDVTSDSDPLALLIMDQDTYDTYQSALKQGSSFDYRSVTLGYTNVISKRFKYSLPAQGKYYLAVVNAPILDNRPDAALVVSPVQAHISVKLIR